MLTLALDVGGTTIAAGLVDPAGALVHTATRSTPNSPRAEDVWVAVEEMIAAALGQRRARWRGGVASAGPIDLPSGTVSPINITGWHGFPLRDRVAAAVPGVPVRLAGDGLCMAVGEHRYGAGAARASCSASWCPPASAVVSCWTAAGTAGAPATPDTSAMWSWTPAVSRAPAAGAAVSRPWPPDRPWSGGHASTVGTLRRV
ncbi:ROK family protein [Mycobacterium xenopi 4042]|uniref:ROK family protein n=1 Tax=Mycobacterium xenopi 4042 TaxID=1299334 RepID=X7YJM5_MYCXE|nr:ROK family protein [Mycobacterium xenopi 4042]